MRTSLGPVALNRPKQGLLEFYKAAVRGGYDEVYIGEVSCPERGAKSKSLLLDIACLIKDSGKKLFISSYCLVTKMKQIEDIKNLLYLADGLEVNNPAFLELDFDKTLIAGPFLNIYNYQSANYFAGLGFERVVLPVDLTLESVIDITKNSQLETEVVFHGRRSLAVSRRCYYLRALGLPDDRCDANCFDEPRGISLDGLFRINGKEILSEKEYSLNAESSLLEDSGVAVLRCENESSI